MPDLPTPEYVPAVGDRIRIRGTGETGRVRSSWPNLREGYADLDRKGRCHECWQPTPRGRRFRYEEVEPLYSSMVGPEEVPPHVMEMIDEAASGKSEWRNAK